MDINRIISELRAEKQQIDRKIALMESLAKGQRRRGRRASWLKEFEGEVLKIKNRPKRGPSSQPLAGPQGQGKGRPRNQELTDDVLGATE